MASTLWMNSGDFINGLSTGQYVFSGFNGEAGSHQIRNNAYINNNLSTNENLTDAQFGAIPLKFYANVAYFRIGGLMNRNITETAVYETVNAMIDDWDDSLAALCRYVTKILVEPSREDEPQHRRGAEA